MKLSAKSEYACIAMLELAANYRAGQPTRIKTIAEAHDINSGFLVQILLQLKTAGLVASVRGASGGYQLARPPEQITLADVLNAVEDRKQARSPLSEAPRSSAALVLQAVWREVQAEEQRLLEQHTLADLLRRAEPAADLTYTI
jgi:Rrf2 family cysteine metabolism transcriptional repressor